MENVLGQLEPQSVFKYFEDMSRIPRGSGKEKEISDYLVQFAKDHRLEVIQDEIYNVIIKKPATPGYETAPPVIIQGHMDMVCEKNRDTVHDFAKDPLKLQIKGDMIYATNTTLGADNGIAVAYALAILASDTIPHPSLEALITVQEEIGLKGAAALDASHLDGKYLINLDSEEEGKLLVSCAGGVRTTQSIPVTWEAPCGENLAAYRISITGLKGGHSGMDIHRGRGNANKLMGRFLNALTSAFAFSIKEINGGAKMNAIPREAEAVILTNADNSSELQNRIETWQKTFENELRTSDPGVMLTFQRLQMPVAKVLSKETEHKVIASLVLIPNGVQSMSMDIEGLVESSTNLGVVKTTDKDVLFESAVRSSVKSLKYTILHQSKMVADILGVRLTTDSDYPEWQYNPDSKMQAICERVYKEKYGAAPEIIALHAGVECGLLKEKKNDLDMISFGPNMYDVHTPNEHLSISSTKHTWEYLLAVLKEMKHA
ncbi:MAG: aminoacyl-histidine dipeptidase [Firmicutes bacterium]|nr:aminoacyl-histidine dipeptidase [Bacillota bacterium]